MHATLLFLYRLASLLLLALPTALVVFDLATHHPKEYDIPLWFKLLLWASTLGAGWISAWFWWRQARRLKNRPAAWLPQLVRAFGQWLGGCVGLGGCWLFVLLSLEAGHLAANFSMLFAPAVGFAIWHTGEWGADWLLKKRAGRL